jgi:hypothetical protein
VSTLGGEGDQRLVGEEAARRSETQRIAVDLEQAGLRRGCHRLPVAVRGISPELGREPGAREPVDQPQAEQDCLELDRAIAQLLLARQGPSHRSFGEVSVEVGDVPAADGAIEGVRAGSDPGVRLTLPVGAIVA